MITSTNTPRPLVACQHPRPRVACPAACRLAAPAYPCAWGCAAAPWVAPCPPRRRAPGPRSPRLCRPLEAGRVAEDALRRLPVAKTTSPSPRSAKVSWHSSTPIVRPLPTSCTPAGFWRLSARRAALSSKRHCRVSRWLPCVDVRLSWFVSDSVTRSREPQRHQVAEAPATPGCGIFGHIRLRKDGVITYARCLPSRGGLVTARAQEETGT